LANVTSTNDWLRSGMGGHNVEVSRTPNFCCQIELFD
jgi:hypothetical protein